VQEVAPLHGDSLAFSFVPSSIADSAPLPIPHVLSSVADSFMPSSVADFAPLSNFPYVPSSIADSAPLSIPYVPSSVADSALLSGSDPELSSSSSGGSDAHRAQAVLTDSNTFASPRSVVFSLQRMRRRE